MTTTNSYQRLLNRPRIVATVHCREDLAAARALEDDDGIDLFELRIDCLVGCLEDVLDLAANAPCPILATVRGRAEGGGNPALGYEERRVLYAQFLPYATAIDIELADTGHLVSTIADARATGKLVVLSQHDFERTPGWEDMLAASKRALDEGADVFKVATLLRSPEDLYVLHRLIDGSPEKIAAMGMGVLGMPSRLLFACAGSRLNYGYLTRPNAPGQWAATRLAQALHECQTSICEDAAQ